MTAIPTIGPIPRLERFGVCPTHVSKGGSAKAHVVVADRPDRRQTFRLGEPRSAKARHNARTAHRRPVIMAARSVSTGDGRLGL